jgi:hypothetical protein
MKEIGNIGAIPVYRSTADIPAGLRVPGMVVAVWHGGDVYEFFGVTKARASSQPGLGIALVAAAGAGSAAGPIGTLVGIGVSLIPSLLGRLFGGGPSQQERDAGSAFEQRAGQTTQLFNQIQSQTVITPADVNRAAGALQQLADFAQQNANEYIARKWNDPSYRPTYEQRLAQIQQAAVQTIAAGTVQPGVAIGAGAATAGGFQVSDYLLPAALVIVAVVLVRR